MQEDQLYAMEHYLEQYQKLVCKYRSENATLRRRIADDYYDEADELPEPRRAPRTPAHGLQPAPRSPLEAPGSPAVEEIQPETPEIDLPDVPPLEGSTSTGTQSGEIITASYEEPPSGEEPANDSDEAATELGALYDTELAVQHTEASAISESQSLTAAERAENPPVWLHGEVVENETGGGPRLTVNVDHFDDSGNHALFEGALSLMLMATSHDGAQHSLARWDFNADEVNAAVVDDAFQPTMQFHLELPADTPLHESTELWVRLVPAEGIKLLAHTPVALQQPGIFSSRNAPHAPPSEEANAAIVVTNEPGRLGDQANDSAAANLSETPSIASRIAVNIVGSDWRIARPNEPVQLPAEPEAGGGWRASTEIVATVVHSKPTPPRKPKQDVQLAAHTETAAAPPAPPAYKPPTWSPERAQRGDGVARKSSHTPRRPAWSATR